MRLKHLVLIAALAAPLTGADQPLGIVEQADAQQVVVRFDASVKLLPGAMLAIYGPGKVEKHPLTKEVIIESRKLVGKAQVLAAGAGDDARLRARVTWRDGELTAGLDAVPLPGEAAPNARPALSTAVSELTAAVQATVRIALPIIDPDGDVLHFSWTLEGAAGEIGSLSARTTSLPEVNWTAPGKAGSATLVVSARDPLGQELVTRVKLVIQAEDDWRKRELKPFAQLGVDRQPTVNSLERDADGSWWGIDQGNAVVHRFVPGWISSKPFAFAVDKGPRRPLALVPFRKELHVLDGKKVSVMVFGPDGNPKREYAPGSSPTDLVIALDGTAFIADQGAGGVQVYEANGKFRARLGREGEGDDAFTGLTKLALGAGGELYCLDPAQNQVQRFDRFQRRLETWKIQADAKNPPIDLALHPKGLLVLLASGQIQVFNAKGLASEGWKGLSESQLVDRAGPANSLLVDASGEVFVTYAEYSYVARHGADGVLNGVRGASLWELPKFAADGQGRLFALNTSTAVVHQYDVEGWRVARHGGLVKSGGSLNRAAALAVSPDGQALSVLDTGTMNIVRFNTASPKDKPLVFAQLGKNNGQLSAPIELAMDAEGRTYVLDAKQHRVQVFDAKGAFLFAFGRYEKGKQSDELLDPTHLAVSLAGDAAYVYDYDTYEVKKYALDQAKAQGVHVNNTGGKGDAPGKFREVVAMGCDRLGLLYLVDSGRGDLQVVDFRGSNAVVGQSRKAADLGPSSLETMALAPDGQIYLAYSGSLFGWRW